MIQTFEDKVAAAQLSNDTPTHDVYAMNLHDALPIS